MPANIGQHSATSSTATTTINRTLTIAAGSTVVVGCSADAERTFSVSDDIVGSYTMIQGATGGSLDQAWASYENHPGGSATITLTVGSNAGIQMFACELTGVATASGFIDDNEQFNLTDNTPTAGAITVAQNAIVLGCLHSGGNPLEITPDADWTTVDEDEAAAHVGGSLIYRVVAAGTFTPGWGLNLSPSTNGISIAFKEADAPAGTPFITQLSAKRV